MCRMYLKKKIANSLVESSGHYDPSTQITTFACYAPKQPEVKQSLILYLPKDDGNYVRHVIDMKHDKTHNVFYVAIKGLSPMADVSQQEYRDNPSKFGALYCYGSDVNNKADLKEYADPCGRHFPAGPEGKVATIIDYTKVPLKRSDSDELPSSIVKISFDISPDSNTNKSTLSPLDKWLTALTGRRLPRFRSIGGIETFPIVEVAALPDLLFKENDGINTYHFINNPPPHINKNWGYDGFGYHCSLSSRFGSPYEWLRFLNRLRELRIIPILDLQLNHCTELDSPINKVWNLLLSELGDWGFKFNYSDPFILEFAVASLRFLKEQFGINHFRLDQIRRAESAPLIEALVNEGNYLFFEAENGWQLRQQITPSSQGKIFYWDFDTLHFARAVLKRVDGWTHTLSLLLDRLIHHPHAIPFYSTHDDYTGRNVPMEFLMMLAKGIPLMFPYDWFDFFRKAS